MDDSGVDRAVAVALGGRDEILEAARHHVPALVDQPKRPVTFLDRTDDAAEGHDVRQLLEADMPLLHLAPDRIGMLLPAGDLGLDPVRLEMRLDAPADSLDQVTAAALVQPLQPFGDRGIG